MPSDAPFSNLVPRHRTLDGFVEAASQAHGVGLTDVDTFTTLVVKTDNSVYRITIVQPSIPRLLEDIDPPETQETPGFRYKTSTANGLVSTCLRY